MACRMQKSPRACEVCYSCWWSNEPPTQAHVCRTMSEQAQLEACGGQQNRPCKAGGRKCLAGRPIAVRQRRSLVDCFAKVGSRTWEVSVAGRVTLFARRRARLVFISSALFVAFLLQLAAFLWETPGHAFDALLRGWRRSGWRSGWKVGSDWSVVRLGGVLGTGYSKLRTGEAEKDPTSFHFQYHRPPHSTIAAGTVHLWCIFRTSNFICPCYNIAFGCRRLVRCSTLFATMHLASTVPG